MVNMDIHSKTLAIVEPCHLIRLPVELRENVYGFLLGDVEKRTDVTTARARRNFQPAMHLRNGVPVVFKEMKALLLTSKIMHTEVKLFIPRSTIYFNNNGDSQGDVVKIFGIDRMNVIYRFEMRLEWHLKCHHRRYWPAIITSFCKMPNLEYLRLYSESFVGAGPYPKHESGDP